MEIDRWIGAEASVIWSLHRYVLLKKKLSQKGKFSFSWPIFIPTLTYAQKCRDILDANSWKRLLHKVAVHYLRYGEGALSPGRRSE